MRRCAWAFLVLVIAVLLLRGLQSSAAADGDADDRAIRALTERFFAAHAQKDLDALMALWSAKSPDYAASKQIMKQLFAATGPITVKGLTVVKVRWDGPTAWVRVRVELTADDKQTGKPQSGLGKLNRVVAVTKEDGEWKIVRYGSARQLLARLELAAATKEERLRTLDDENDLVDPEYVEMLLREGDAQARRGEFPRAARLQDLALEVARGLGDKDALARCYLYQGMSLGEQSRYEPALERHRKALALFREAKDRDGEKETLVNIGFVCYAAGRKEDALRPYQDALQIVRDLGNSSEEAQYLGVLGLIYRDTGRYKEALERFQEGLKIARDLGDRSAEADALGNLGTTCWLADRYEEAMKHEEDCLQIRRALNDRRGEADALNILGNACRDLGRNEEALRHYQDGLRIARDLGDRRKEAQALNNLGNVYDSTGRCDEAVRNFQESLRISRDLGERDGEATALGNLGVAYQLMGRYGEALRHYRDAYTISRDLGDRHGELIALGNIGNAYAAAGRNDEALRYFQDALRIARDSDDRHREAQLLNNLGQLSLEAERYAEALKQFQDSLRIKNDLGDRAGEAGALNNIGVVCEDEGQYAEALQHYQDGLKIQRDLGDQDGEAIVLNNIGRAFRLTGRYDEALRSARDGLEIAGRVGDPETVSACYRNLGFIREARKQWDEAVEAQRAAVRRVELLRTNTAEPSLQTSFLAQHTSSYWHLARDLLELDKPAEAFAAAEEMKARGLVDILRQGKADLRRGMNEDERKHEQSLQGRLTTLGVRLEGLRGKKADAQAVAGVVGDLEKARQELEDFRHELFLHRPELQARRAEFAPAGLDDLGRSLFAGRPGLVVLSYLVGDDQTLLFVLTRGERDGGSASLTVHRIDVGEKDLVEAVDAFRAACADSAAAAPDGDDLYRWLIAPAADELASARQLIIAPAGVLYTLPFQALRDPNGRYLVERLPVSYAPSVTALTKMEELGAARRKEYVGKPPTLLAVGVSDFGRREKPLPAALAEVRGLAEAFGDNAKLLPGAEATRARVEASWSGCRYLHFATHGRLNSDAPLYSSLVLSPADANDEGVLYAQELVNADVPAEMAVMSACETGLGRRVDGEGLLGLSWSWFAAGVPSTVASQWSVGDASTARLMKTFYARLTAGDSKAEALRQAELTLLADPATRHPFYWAPFVLVGDDR